MSNEVNTSKLLAELQAVVRDAEALLKATAADTSEKIQHARARAEESLRQAKGRLDEAESSVLESARDAMDKATSYVKTNPWQALGVVAVVGVVVGMLLRRKD